VIAAGYLGELGENYEKDTLMPSTVSDGFGISREPIAQSFEDSGQRTRIERAGFRLMAIDWRPVVLPVE
jgi:hypothetical protein